MAKVFKALLLLSCAVMVHCNDEESEIEIKKHMNKEQQEMHERLLKKDGSEDKKDDNDEHHSVIEAIVKARHDERKEIDKKIYDEKWLRAKKTSELSKLAAGNRASEDQLSACMDSDNPKEAFIALIYQIQKPHIEAKRIKELHEEHDRLAPDMKKLADELGGSEELEDPLRFLRNHDTNRDGRLGIYELQQTYGQPDYEDPLHKAAYDKGFRHKPGDLEFEKIAEISRAFIRTDKDGDGFLELKDIPHFLVLMEREDRDGPPPGHHQGPEL